MDSIQNQVIGGQIKMLPSLGRATAHGSYTLNSAQAGMGAGAAAGMMPVQLCLSLQWARRETARWSLHHWTSSLPRTHLLFKTQEISLINTTSNGTSGPHQKTLANEKSGICQRMCKLPNIWEKCFRKQVNAPSLQLWQGRLHCH